MRTVDMSATLLLSAPSSLELRTMKLSQRDRARIAPAMKPRLCHKRVEALSANEPSLHIDVQQDCIVENPSASASCSSSSPCIVENPSASASNLLSERGIAFSTGPSFFRAQSSLGRDLAVLAAALYKRSHGRLRVLDAMSGCGIRALRYLTQSEADFVLVNDCNPNLHSTIVENLSRYVPLEGLDSPALEPLFEASTLGNPRKQTDTEKNVDNVENYSSTPVNSKTHGFGGTQTATRVREEEGCLSVDGQSIKRHKSTALEFPLALEISDNSSKGDEHSSRREDCSSSGEEGVHPFESGNLHMRRSSVTSLHAQYSVNTFPYGVPCNTQGDIERETFLSNAQWQVCHEEAARLLLKCNLNMDFYDFIDVDSFGSDSFFLGPALSALRFGGLLFVTCTDGFSSGGHRPYNSLAQYGTFMRPMPYANELGLRMLMGAVVKEAAIRNMSVSPIFSVYAPHGPVFRVLLRATSGKPEKIMHYGFIYYCGKCGDSRSVDWEKLGSTCCPCSDKVSDSIKMSGPLWTGPLHNANDIQDIIGLAKEWGWIPSLSEHECLSNLGGGRRKKKQEKLLELLNLMLEESHPELPFGYLHLDEIAKRGKIQSPRRETLIKALRNEGYIASRSQICSNAVKTNCSMTSCIALARRLAEDAGR